MSLKSLYREYFQKSRVFIYPLLEIKRGVSVTPLNTYMSWEGVYTPQDCKLICVYHLRRDQEFVRFEKYKLLNNKYLIDFKQTEDEKGIYIFDFSSMKYNWNCILNGKYSELTDKHKEIVKNHYLDNDTVYAYIESYLNPSKYFYIYSEILGVHVDELKKVGELCSKPDLDKEHLVMDVKSITINKEK